MARRHEILNPLPVRIWHWVHGICILLLVLTGIQLRFPDTFPLFGVLRKAVHLHNVCGFIVIFDYIFWLIFYYAVEKDLGKQYVPTRRDLLQGIPAQANYYFSRIFLGEPAPFHPTRRAKFNSLQKTAYFGIMFIMLPLQMVTGLLLWNVKAFHPIIELLGGVRVVDAFHIILAYIFISFLITHTYLATLGPTFLSHFKAMVLGYED